MLKHENYLIREDNCEVIIKNHKLIFYVPIQGIYGKVYETSFKNNHYSYYERMGQILIELSKKDFINADILYAIAKYLSNISYN